MPVMATLVTLSKHAAALPTIPSGEEGDREEKEGGGIQRHTNNELLPHFWKENMFD